MSLKSFLRRRRVWFAIVAITLAGTSFALYKGAERHDEQTLGALLACMATESCLVPVYQEEINGEPIMSIKFVSEQGVIVSAFFTSHDFVVSVSYDEERQLLMADENWDGNLTLITQTVLGSPGVVETYGKEDGRFAAVKNLYRSLLDEMEQRVIPPNLLEGSSGMH